MAVRGVYSILFKMVSVPKNLIEEHVTTYVHTYVHLAGLNTTVTVCVEMFAK